jgi:hypothetical protein
MENLTQEERQRLDWLALFCQLPPLAVDVIRVLLPLEKQRTGRRWLPLRSSTALLAEAEGDWNRLESPLFALREWGIVRVSLEPEPEVMLCERIAGFLLGAAPFLLYTKQDASPRGNA